jgi:hypothetical protein
MMQWDVLKNRYEGKTCVVIGNGPSLRNVPLAFLRQYLTFGTNRIYLLAGFRPTFYVAVNPLVVEQSLPQIIELDASVSFLPTQYAALVPGALGLRSTGGPAFSPTPDQWVYEGFTVTYVCLQLAHWMGFRRVLLVGVDHKYTYNGAPNEEHIAEGPDPNHFDPTYFSGGTRWNNPDLQRSEAAYSMARLVYRATDREIINLTEGSALDIFPKADLKNFWRGDVN